MTRDPAVRTREVLGQGPRITPAAEPRLDERHHTAMETLRLTYGYPEGTPLAPFFGTLSHSPEFFAGYIALGAIATVGCSLPARVREMAILRCGWLCGAPYQWGEHVHVTRGRLFDDAEIEGLKAGPDAACWMEIDRAVLAAVDELYADQMITDATWGQLAAHLDRCQLVELPMLVGHYVMTAMLQNSLRSPLNDHNKGLEA